MRTAKPDTLALREVESVTEGRRVWRDVETVCSAASSVDRTKLADTLLC